MGAPNPNEIDLLEWLETTVQDAVDLKVAEVTGWGNYLYDELTSAQLDTLMLSRLHVVVDPEEDRQIEFTDNENRPYAANVIDIELDMTATTESSSLGSAIYSDVDFNIYIMVSKVGKSLREYKRDVILIKNFILDAFKDSRKYVGINSCEYDDFDTDIEGLNLSTCLMSVTLLVNKHDYTIN